MQMMIRLMRFGLKLAAFGALVGLVAGALPSLHPMADSFSHFRVHFAAVLAVCLMLLAFGWAGRAKRAAMLCACGLVAGIGYVWISGPPGEAGDASFRLVQFNLHFRNRDMDRVVASLREVDADIVTLQEMTDGHRVALTKLADLYPNQTHCAFARVGGVSILSKTPFVKGRGGCAEGLGLGWEQVQTGTGPVTVAVIHNHWPWPFDQHLQIDRMAPWLSAMKTPMIVAGDFNAAPWSHAVTRVEQATRTETVPGLRMTIGLKLLPVVPALPIPIDHVLLSDELCARAARVGPDLGSDHWPVIVEFDWKAAAQEC